VIAGELVVGPEDLGLVHLAEDVDEAVATLRRSLLSGPAYDARPRG
jgi:hypothetical protein